MENVYKRHHFRVTADDPKWNEHLLTIKSVLLSGPDSGRVSRLDLQFYMCSKSIEFLKLFHKGALTINFIDSTTKVLDTLEYQVINRSSGWMKLDYGSTELGTLTVSLEIDNGPL